MKRANRLKKRNYITERVQLHDKRRSGDLGAKFGISKFASTSDLGTLANVSIIRIRVIDLIRLKAYISRVRKPVISINVHVMCSIGPLMLAWPGTLKGFCPRAQHKRVMLFMTVHRACKLIFVA